MADFMPPTEWHQLGSKLDTQLSDDQISAFKDHIHSRRIAERRRRVVLAGTAAAGVVVALVLSIIQTTSESALAPPPTSAKTDDAQPLSDDGTSLNPIAVALVTGTRFDVEEGASRRIYRVASGQVRFETREDDDKSLEVRVGDLVIEDVGTVFTVECLPRDRARVSVMEGHVRVTWPGGKVILEPYDSGVFPLEQPTVTKPLVAAKQPRRTNVSPETDWRTLAKNGEYRRALGRLEQDPTIVTNRVSDLLLAADVMRLCGKFEQAVSYLNKVVKRHGRDSRAKLAAFTLGRVYLDELGRPKAAANMFRKAGSGKSPLAEEALAREVEAWSRAKAADRARETAIRYLTRYPNGDRVNAVQSFGGLDENER